MKWYEVEEAQQLLYEKSRPVGSVRLPLEDAAGLVLAEDVKAKITQPPFCRSAMDGYALCCDELQEKIDEKSPQDFFVSAAVFAGDGIIKMQHNTAVRIMTGAPLPLGADVVIPQEMTDYGETRVRLFGKLSKYANCVPAGEDFFAGDVIAKAGDVVDAYTVAAAAAGGVTELCVHPAVKAAIITTGSELVEVGKTLMAGQIYDANKAFFKSRLRELGCKVVRAKHCADDPKAIRTAMEEAAEVADLIITTGGVSVGRKDYLPAVISEMGAEIIFRKISVKPGSPTMAALYKEKTILCLSGNPYSAIAMFEVLFPHYEKKALQKNELRIKALSVPTINGYPKKSVNRRLIRGILQKNGVWIPTDQRNGQLHGGIGSNCLIDIPRGSDALVSGDVVRVWLLT